jgi:hypothetical protein
MFVAVMFAGIFVLGNGMETSGSQVAEQDDIVKFKEIKFSVLMHSFVQRLYTNKYFKIT